MPIYEVLDVPGDNDRQIIVMPMLRRYDDPPFESVADVVDFFRQTIEVCISIDMSFPAFNNTLRVSDTCMPIMLPIGT